MNLYCTVFLFQILRKNRTEEVDEHNMETQSKLFCYSSNRLMFQSDIQLTARNSGVHTEDRVDDRNKSTAKAAFLIAPT